MAISGLDHVSLLVSDTECALAFYRDLLGLAVNPKRPDLGYPGAWLDLADGRQIHLLELPSPDPTQGRPAHGGRDRHLALRVEGFAALARRLEQAGLPFSLSKSGRSALFCRDPDGNAVELIGEDDAPADQRLRSNSL